MRLPKIVGKYARGIYSHVKEVLIETRNPIALVGPTGTAKTLIMLRALNWYSRKFDVPSYYLQMSPDVSRTTLVGGFRLVNGSLVPVKGVIMRAMDEGGIVGLDEFTHAEPEDQASLNSALASESLKLVSIGEIEARARSTTRFIIAHNPIAYGGNKLMPLALRRRFYVIEVDFPPADDELMIVNAILKREYKIKMPDYWTRFLVSVVRSVRSEDAPISPANIAMALASVHRLLRGRVEYDINLENLSGRVSEPFLRGLYEKIHWKSPETVSELYEDKELIRLLMDCYSVDRKLLLDRVYAGCMGAYLPSKIREQIAACFPV